MNRLRGLLLAVAVMLPLAAWADGGLAVDARFDKTGDKLVDASDWPKMTVEEKMAYARESLQALGEDPDVMLPEGRSRADHYLDGLKAVYE